MSRPTSLIPDLPGQSDGPAQRIGPSPLLTPDEAAAWLRVTKGHLARLRVVGGGPAFVKLSRRCIAYRLEDLESFITQRIRRSTSDQGD